MNKSKEPLVLGKRAALAVQLSDEERAAFQAAAEAMGLRMRGSWMRAVARAAAGLREGEPPRPVTKPVRTPVTVGLNGVERAAVAAAAAELGLSSSDWIRVVCRAAAGLR